MWSQAGWEGLEVPLRDRTCCSARGAGDKGQLRAFPWAPDCVEGVQKDRREALDTARPTVRQEQPAELPIPPPESLVWFSFSLVLPPNCGGPAVTQVVIHSSSSRDLENRRIPGRGNSPRPALAFPVNLTGCFPGGSVGVVSAECLHLTPLNHAPTVPFVRFPLH